MTPEDLRYTEEHEWIRDLGEGRVRVGITDFAQSQLGDIVYVTPPSIDTAVTAGDPLGEVESTKSVSDLYSPVDGTVVRVNEALDEGPETINDDPYGEGWIVEIKLDGDPAAVLGELLDAAAYQQLIQQ